MRQSIVLILLLLALTGGVLADDVEDLLLRGRELLAQERAEEAALAFEKALLLAPGDAQARQGVSLSHAHMGRRELAAGRVSGAIERFRLALGYWQEDPDLNLWLGVAYFRNREYFAARNEFRHVLRRRPDDAKALEYVGYTYYKEDRLDLAVENWSRSLERAPGNSNLESWLARARREIEIEKGYRKTRSDHFLALHESDREALLARRVLDILDEAYVSVGNDLELFPEEALPVVLYPERAFRDVTGANPWIGGLYDGKIRLPVPSMPDQDEDLRRLLYHEYTHALVSRIDPGAPAWLGEGLAQLEEGLPTEPFDALVREAFRRDEWIPFENLADPFHSAGDLSRVELAYAESFLFVSYLATRYGKGILVRVLVRSGAGAPLSDAFRAETGGGLDELVADWRAGFE